MICRRPLRLATLLGPNTIDDLHRLGAHLTGRELPATVVEVDATASVSDALTEGGIDVLWACGLLTAELVDDGAALDVVAAPVFRGETVAVYRSIIVTRAGDSSPVRRLAVNEYGSWSGYRALYHDATVRADNRWHPDRMDEIVVTGSHVASASAVVDGRADVAAIDHSVWNWLAAVDPDAVRDLVVSDRTVDCPAPPLSVGSTAPAGDRRVLIDALLAFEGPPLLLPASVDDYRFMLA